MRNFERTLSNSFGFEPVSSLESTLRPLHQFIKSGCLGWAQHGRFTVPAAWGWAGWTL